jgi:hypothetical protein
MHRALPLLAIFILALAVRLYYLAGVEAYPRFELIRNRLDVPFGSMISDHPSHLLDGLDLRVHGPVQPALQEAFGPAFAAVWPRDQLGSRSGSQR